MSSYIYIYIYVHVHVHVRYRGLGNYYNIEVYDWVFSVPRTLQSDVALAGWGSEVLKY